MATSIKKGATPSLQELVESRIAKNSATISKLDKNTFQFHNNSSPIIEEDDEDLSLSIEGNSRKKSPETRSSKSRTSTTSKQPQKPDDLALVLRQPRLSDNINVSSIFQSKQLSPKQLSKLFETMRKKENILSATTPSNIGKLPTEIPVIPTVPTEVPKTYASVSSRPSASVRFAEPFGPSGPSGPSISSKASIPRPPMKTLHPSLKPFVIYIIGNVKEVDKPRSYLCNFMTQMKFLKEKCGIDNYRVQLICGRNEEAHKQVGKRFYENMGKDQDYRNSCLSTEEESKPLRSSFAYKCIPYGVDVTYIDETYDAKKLIDTFKFILQDKTIQHRTPIILIYDTPDNQTSDANIKLGNVDISGKDLTRIFDMYSENRKLMIFTSNNSEKYISAMKDKPENTVFFGCKEGTRESLLKFYTADKNDVLDKTLFLENHSAFDKNGFIIKVNENNASPIYITDIFQNAHSGKMYV